MKKAKISMFLACVLGAICCLGACVKPKTDDLVLYVPDGAPAMAFAPMMEEDTADDGVEYRVVNPAVIASKVTNADESKNADICVLPVTAAAKLLGTGERYVSLGVVTSGNLYVLTKDDALKEALEASEYKNLDCLIGKTVGVMKINDLPGLTFKSVLTEYGVEWQELKNDGTMSATKVNLKAIADATAIDPTDDSVACYLVAEPAASVQMKKNGFVIACSLETLYHKGVLPSENEYQGYPQAVMVVKKSVADSKKSWLNDFMARVQASTETVNSDWASGERIVTQVRKHLEDPSYTSTLNANVLSGETIVRCRVGFVYNALSKTAVQLYLARIVAMNENATKIPADVFFYEG